MTGNRENAKRQIVRVVLKDGSVVCDGVQLVYAEAFVSTWNRLIDRTEASAYIQPVLEMIRKPTG